MKTDLNVISKTNLPTGTPWKGTAIVYLLMKQADAPHWAIVTLLILGAAWLLLHLLIRAFEIHINVFKFEEEDFFINKVRSLLTKTGK